LLFLYSIGRYSDNSTQDITSSVIWSTSNTSIASVSNAANSWGQVSGISAGNVSVVATQNSISGSTTLTVNYIAGTPVIKVGVNFEDLKVGDDYNDLVLCFNGKLD